MLYTDITKVCIVKLTERFERQGAAMTINAHILISPEFLKGLCSLLLGLAVIFGGKTVVSKTKKTGKADSNSQESACNSNDTNSDSRETKGGK